MNRHVIAIEIASRPAAGERVSGDSWQVAWLETACRLALVRGEGHGLAAANGATAATEALAAQPRLDPARTVARCREMLNTTRGAAMFVAGIDVAARSITVAGAGRIEAWFCRESQCHHLVSGGEIAGGALGQVDQIELPIGAEWLLAVYADGLAGERGDALTSTLAAPAPPRAIAEAVRAVRGSLSGDATILLAHPRWELA